MKTGFFLSLIGILLLALWGRGKVFVKLGIPGGKGWIPLYGGCRLYQQIWKPEMFFLALMGCCGRLMNWSLLGMALFSDISYLYDDVSPGGLAVMFILIGTELIFALAGLAVHFLAMRRLSAAFGRGWGYAVGLLLLSPVFFLHLGCSAIQPAHTAGSNQKS